MPRRTKKKSTGNIHGPRGKKTQRGDFWNAEYDQRDHLAISDAVSGDLLKFFRWCERRDTFLLPTAYDSVLDIGCGNGRNILYVSEAYSCAGVGYDLSEEAIAQCTQKAIEQDLPVRFHVQSVADPIPLADGSQKLVLDMMVSHVLDKAGRQALLAEIDRVLEDDGLLFLKTFLRDGDLGAEELITKYPGTEEGSYIHPKIGIQEHVFWEDEIMDDVEAYFQIHKVYKSHRHRDRQGRAAKRRSIVLYAQKRPR